MSDVASLTLTTWYECPVARSGSCDTLSTPARKFCGYCGARLMPRRGSFLVVPWRKDGRYGTADALAGYASKATAYKAVDRLTPGHAGHAGGLVVRWIDVNREGDE